jgi:hypothetical protein
VIGIDFHRLKATINHRIKKVLIWCWFDSFYDSIEHLVGDRGIVNLIETIKAEFLNDTKMGG